MISIDEIKNFFQGSILVNEPMSKYTSMRVGGPADLLITPANKEDAVNLITYLQKNIIDYIVMGNGTNLLVSDTGVRSVVVNFSSGLNQIKIENNLVKAEAGIILARFVDFCIRHSRSGVEKLAGIPGTIGGAILMNAGAYGSQISDFIYEIEIVKDGQLQKIKKEDANFGYRTSGFANSAIIGASFDLPEGKIDELMRTKTDYLQRRNQSQPLNFPNSGSIFKNPEGNYAAKLIEEAGLKGTRLGAAQISEKHGNFIVNLCDCSANDIIQLINIVRKTVYSKNKIKLIPEIKLVGFNNEVLDEF
ncbi:MAG: UDP-N-acetylmuramate dehydrogenase [Bacteroidota bacterium]|nr:UDP-N-acetylmuramate dehydrogenase [Bacteroidota bacterium]